MEYIELLGYIGTAIVLISMIPSSITKIRILNVSGSIICVIYSLIISAYPITFLNTGMIIINLIKLISEAKKGKTK